MNKKSYIFILLIGIILVSGCASGGDVEKPSQPPASAYEINLPSDMSDSGRLSLGIDLPSNMAVGKTENIYCYSQNTDKFKAYHLAVYWKEGAEDSIKEGNTYSGYFANVNGVEKVKCYYFNPDSTGNYVFRYAVYDCADVETATGSCGIDTNYLTLDKKDKNGEITPIHSITKEAIVS